MTQCQYCSSTLVTSGLSSGQQIRCANCLSLFTFGKVEKVPTHRMAWRSFWLGLSSIVLLFLTGLPAIYYGIRSLLRMRFVKPKSSDRAAAIAGTALGGCFGVIVGFVVICLLIIGLIAFLTYHETNVEVEVVQECREFFDFEIRVGTKPVKATSVFNNHQSFQFADRKLVSERKIRIQLMHAGLSIQTNKDQFVQTLQGKRVNHQSMGKPQLSETLKWDMGGEAVDVRKTIYLRQQPRNKDTDEHPAEDEPPVERPLDEEPTEDDPIETHQYFAYLLQSSGYYGLVVVFEPDGFDLSESDVRSIFSNTKILTKMKTPTPMDSK